jgi:hypothetical protein
VKLRKAREENCGLVTLVEDGADVNERIVPGVSLLLIANKNHTFLFVAKLGGVEGSVGRIGGNGETGLGETAVY